jgi:hypothetical protein
MQNRRFPASESYLLQLLDVGFVSALTPAIQVDFCKTVASPGLSSAKLPTWNAIQQPLRKQLLRYSSACSGARVDNNVLKFQKQYIDFQTKVKK